MREGRAKPPLPDRSRTQFTVTGTVNGPKSSWFSAMWCRLTEMFVVPAATPVSVPVYAAVRVNVRSAEFPGMTLNSKAALLPTGSAAHGND